MHPIPPQLKKQLTKDPSMKICIYDSPECSKRIEWEHCWIYSGRQIQEAWAIVGCCTYHHRDAGLDKNFNQFMSLKKAMQMRVFVTLPQKYPRVDWLQKYNFLKKKYSYEQAT